MARPQRARTAAEAIVYRTISAGGLWHPLPARGTTRSHAGTGPWPLRGERTPGRAHPVFRWERLGAQDPAGRDRRPRHLHLRRPVIRPLYRRHTHSTPPITVRPGICTPKISWYEVAVRFATCTNGCTAPFDR